MVKFFLLFLITFTLSAQTPSPLIQKNCLDCHIQQKIPSELIYRRYLMQYSTHKSIREVLFSYLKNPQKRDSIMPKQFFLKFPSKDMVDLNDTLLLDSIDAYLDYFDIKKKLSFP